MIPQFKPLQSMVVKKNERGKKTTRVGENSETTLKNTSNIFVVRFHANRTLKIYSKTKHHCRKKESLLVKLLLSSKIAKCTQTKYAVCYCGGGEGCEPHLPELLPRLVPFLAHLLKDVVGAFLEPGGRKRCKKGQS